MREILKGKVMLKKAYIEITNECNLCCSFCHGTKRKVRYMTAEEFEKAARALVGYTEYLYFHILGEPLLHPLLGDFLSISEKLGFKVIITTNGTLLKEKSEILLNSSALHKISISLHAYEANQMNVGLDEYLDSCFSFCKDVSRVGKISVMRLWNIGGEESQNAVILKKMKDFFGGETTECRNGFQLADKLFFEWGDKFEWPDENAESYSETHTCYGLRQQIGILCDGRVVPCCLDSEGTITLGNIFENDLGDILSSPRALALKRSFETRQIKENLCRHCGFAITRLR